MIIIDKYLEQLEKSGKPIRVGLVGAGFAGRGFALQLLTVKNGMKLVAISNRTTSYANQAYQEAGISHTTPVSNARELEQAITTHTFAYTDDPNLLCESPLIDVIVEATGEVEFGCHVVMSAIKHKKHVVLINAELDGTLGPILKKYADKEGVIYTQGDGDQPAKLMNLSREVQGMGFQPLLLGNIKSLLDHYRTPKTQEKFAFEHFQRAKHITSFADGTKISYEMATVANATGMGVGVRGMYGPACSHVDDAHEYFSLEKHLKNGIVDYILGANPSFGVFVLGYSEQETRRKYMGVYKMGQGPVYTFYIPYHLSSLEAPASVARAVLFKDATLAPRSEPVCDVITIAKKDLKRGEQLDGIGGYTCYGTIENSNITNDQNLLPMGLSEGCIVRHDVTKDTALTYDDVKLPEGRFCDQLRQRQREYFQKVKGITQTAYPGEELHAHLPVFI